MATTTDKDAVYKIVSEQLLQLLEGGHIPWDKPWDASAGMPASMSTNKPYRGINVFLLGMEAQIKGYTSPWWATFNKIKELGGAVRKGEKGTLVIFWKINKKTVRNAAGEREEQVYPLLRYYKVFNADQCDGLPDRYTQPAATRDNATIDAAQTILDNYTATLASVAHGGDQAYYIPTKDHIQMPDRRTFIDAESYYSTFFHEATHSTGHTSRLHRDGLIESHRFGDEWYAREELVAEFGAAMLCGIAGVEKATIRRSAAYLQNWITVLKSDVRLAVNAAAAAQKAADLILAASDTPGEQDTGQDTAAELATV